MSEDPQDSQFSQPPQEPIPGMEPAASRDPSSLPPNLGEPGSPDEPLSSEAPQIPASADYISEIRQSLASEETGGRRHTGGLIRRITGSLRRVTGPLRIHTDPLKTEKPEPQAGEQLPAAEQAPELSAAQPEGTLEQQPDLSQPPEEIADDFLTGRLGDMLVGEGPGESDSWPAGPQEETDLRSSMGVDEGTFPEETRPGWNEPSTPRFDSEDDFDIGGTSLEAGEKTQLKGDEPISLLENGWVASQGMAGEDEKQAEEPDWMSAIREEAAREDAAREDAARKKGGRGKAGPQDTEEKPSSRDVTSPVRDFITSVLHRSDEKRKRPGENEIPDDMVTGRLERTLGSAPLAAAPAETDSGQEPEVPEPAGNEPAVPPVIRPEDEYDFDKHFATLFGEDEVLSQTGTSVNAFPLEGLEARFGQVEGDAENLTREDFQINNLSPEDEALLWGEAAGQADTSTDAQAPITPEDIWGQEAASGPDVLDETSLDQVNPTLAEDLWGRPEEPTPGSGIYSDDAYAAAFLTGSDLPPLGQREPQSPQQDFLLQQALEKSRQEEAPPSMDEIRAIALEDYQDELGARAWVKPEREEELPGASAGEAEWYGEVPQPEGIETESADSTGTTASTQAAPQDTAPAAGAIPAGEGKSWLAAYSSLQKILLAEAAIVVIAMLVAIPFFILMIARGPIHKGEALQPHPLPAGLPYPTGLTLPGGWSFPVSKSTFTNGVWKPVTSEWLEGTELRRVIALPWNPQTEAVIQTFHKGDPVLLQLSNNDTAQYKVTSVERVPVSNKQIYDDRAPSLAIILYQEKAKERWVIICNP